MKTQLFLEGVVLGEEGLISCPLTSNAILFVLQYCQTKDFEIMFTPNECKKSDNFKCRFAVNQVMKNLEITTMRLEEIPMNLQNVSLPSLYQPSLCLVRSGLCVVLRHIIKVSHIANPHLHVIDMLGFRQGSIRMCAEVSGWTKLCEVDLASSLTALMSQLEKLSSNDQESVENISEIGNRIHDHLVLPTDLLRLESHFGKKCRVHSDGKKRRAELEGLKKYFSGLQEKLDQHHTEMCLDERNDETHSLDALCKLSISDSIPEPSVEFKKLVHNNSHISIEVNLLLQHGIRQIKVEKTFHPELVFPKSDHSSETSVSNRSTHADQHSVPVCGTERILEANGGIDLEAVKLDSLSVRRLCHVLEHLTYQDIEYGHVYSEGVEMTVADLIIFAYVYQLMVTLQFNCRSLSSHIPKIMRWMSHMVSLPTVMNACDRIGWSMQPLVDALKDRMAADEKVDGGSSCLSFIIQKEEELEEDDMELSRCAKMKHKAIKPEVVQALRKLEVCNVSSKTGCHPRGENVQVDWIRLPPGVHPKEGDVPEKRTQRKCQQLENLITAVQSMAQPGDIIVDFCSGGGHLGIAVAYLLPQCQVYLVENKEESLLRACSRLDALQLHNVTLYQCNLDYFIGQFQVGVCLHACGSATDMVLQLCLDSWASFVICPCCYGSIQKSHLLSYPRSEAFIQTNLTYKDFLTLGHAADQTEFNIALEGQGHQCMNLVDTDRAEYARQLGYHVTLCSLKPLSCTPKNNLLVGTPGS